MIQTQEESVIIHDSLQIDNDGYVYGSAYTKELPNGDSLTGGVTSYEYKDGELNHVPGVTLVDESGAIKKEYSPYDTTNAETAIDRVRTQMENAFKDEKRRE